MPFKQSTSLDNPFISWTSSMQSSTCRSWLFSNTLKRPTIAKSVLPKHEAEPLEWYTARCVPVPPRLYGDSLPLVRGDICMSAVQISMWKPKPALTRGLASRLLLYLCHAALCQRARIQCSIAERHERRNIRCRMRGAMPHKPSFRWPKSI